MTKESNSFMPWSGVDDEPEQMKQDLGHGPVQQTVELQVYLEKSWKGRTGSGRGVRQRRS